MHNRLGPDISVLSSSLSTLRPRFRQSQASKNDRIRTANASLDGDLSIVPFQSPLGRTFSRAKIYPGNIYRQRIAEEKLSKIYPVYGGGRIRPK